MFDLVLYWLLILLFFMQPENILMASNITEFPFPQITYPQHGYLKPEFGYFVILSFRQLFDCLPFHKKLVCVCMAVLVYMGGRSSRKYSYLNICKLKNSKFNDCRYKLATNYVNTIFLSGFLSQSIGLSSLVM